MCVTYKAKWRWQVSLVSVRKVASQERVSGEKRVAVKPLLNVQCSPMSLEKVWQAILRQFWRYVRPRVNPKDGFDFNEILWSFLDQSRRWGQELRTWSPFTVILATLYRRFRASKGLHVACTTIMALVPPYMYIYLLVMCSVSTNGERASLANLKLTIGSLLECC